jgi:ATP-dependent RNA helicase DDX24/MAK5
MGEGAVGLSLSLVSPKEDKVHGKIVEALHVDFVNLHMDGRLMKEAQERVNLASKIVSADQVQSKTHNQNQWFKQQAEEAGLELDDDMLTGGLEEGDLKDKTQLRESKQAKGKLRALLCEPMRTQRHGKFLSAAAMAKHREIEPLPLTAKAAGGPSRKKRKTKR